jgi:hypothetical protein
VTKCIKASNVLLAEKLAKAIVDAMRKFGKKEIAHERSQH